MYKLNKLCGLDIVKPEVVKQTDKTVIYINKRFTKPQRDMKKSRYYEWFETFDDAKKRAVEIADEKVVSAKFNLQQAQGLLGHAKGLKEPEQQ